MISLKHVFKYFGEFRALNDVSLEVAAGERVVVCGPSGSGKSTMIRCINRLEEHDDGEIWVSGNQLTEDVKKLTEIRKDVGMVFQRGNHLLHGLRKDYPPQGLKAGESNRLAGLGLSFIYGLNTSPDNLRDVRSLKERQAENAGNDVCEKLRRAQQNLKQGNGFRRCIDGKFVYP